MTDETSGLQDLLESFPDARRPADAIRMAARERLEVARGYGLSGPPFDPHVFASLLDIKTRPGDLSPGLEAMIVPDQSGSFTIVWDPKQPRKRTNFSVAHEIGHTLFADCGRMAHFRRENDEADIEVLCDIAAAEFLMPKEEFTRDVREFGTSLDSVIRLSARYQASMEAIGIRMQHVCDLPLAVLVAGLDGGAIARLVLQYSRANTGYRSLQPHTQLSPGTVVPRYSLIQKAIRSPLRTQFSHDREVWYVGGRRHDFEIETMSIPSRPGSPPRVLALLRPAL